MLPGLLCIGSDDFSHVIRVRELSRVLTDRRRQSILLAMEDIGFYVFPYG